MCVCDTLQNDSWQNSWELRLTARFLDLLSVFSACLSLSLSLVPSACPSLLHSLVPFISAYLHLWSLLPVPLVCIAFVSVLPWLWPSCIYAGVNIPISGFMVTHRLDIKILLDSTSPRDPKRCDNKIFSITDLLSDIFHLIHRA